VVEYLGVDYPLYFLTLEEAARKALDMGLIRDAHQYLKGCETRGKLSAEYFRRSSWKAKSTDRSEVTSC